MMKSRYNLVPLCNPTYSNNPSPNSPSESSFWAFSFFCLRGRSTIGKETVLEQGLEGYSEYKQRVKYKLIPFIW